MMNVPLTVPPSVLHRLLADLGVPEDRWRDVTDVRVRGGYWHIRLVRRDADGHFVIVRNGPSARVALERYDIKVQSEVSNESDRPVG